MSKRRRDLTPSADRVLPNASSMSTPYHQLSDKNRPASYTRMGGVGRVAVLVACVAAVGACSHGTLEGSTSGGASTATVAAIASSVPAPVSSAPASSSAGPGGASSAAAVAAVASSCPEGTVAIPAGTFWMGAPYAYNKTSSEWKHKVAVRSFCLDLTEVTAGTYQACVDNGGCTAARKGFSCTAGRAGREEHPANCMDWFQADAACKAFHKRLPTEQEWEYAARGGAEQRTYSWGEQDPEGHACYNHPGTCRIKSYPAGAFGLYDMMGGVWEWTSSPFVSVGEWSLPDVWRVYRGGSFSRRFPKWMKGWVRNRFRPKEYGGHLGFRCALDLAGSACPEGAHDGADGGCEVDGAISSTAPLNSEHPRHVAVPAGSSTEPKSQEDKGPKPATVSRDPQYDADCAQYKPGRPICHNVKGGNFADRERIRRQMGCANRDVGLDFNSICCPGAPKSSEADSGAATDGR